MHINIVTVTSGWILSKIAERLYTAGNSITDHEFTLSYAPNMNADVNFYVDVQNCFRQKTPGLDIGFFTHVHEDNIVTVNNITFSLDYIFHMCDRYYKMFSKRYPLCKMKVLPVGGIVNGFELKKPKIGIVQRGQYEGKGFNFMLGLDTDRLKDFRFLFVGSGWDEVVSKYEAAGIEVEYTTYEKYDSYPQHYEDMDYLLIPSLWEGGPMSVMEAFSTGTPIIASNVGWIPDLGVEYMFEPGNSEALYSILDGISGPIKARRDKVSEITYTGYIHQLMNVIKELEDE